MRFRVEFTIDWVRFVIDSFLFGRLIGIIRALLTSEALTTIVFLKRSSFFTESFADKFGL